MTNRLPDVKQPPPSLATLRLIVTVIVMLSCVAGGAVLFSGSRIGAKIFANPLVGLIVAGFAAIVFVQQFFITHILKKPSPNADESTILKVYGTEILTRVFLLEGAVMLCYVFYLLTLSEAILGVTIVLVLTMLFLRPSAASYQQWRANLT